MKKLDFFPNQWNFPTIINKKNNSIKLWLCHHIIILLILALQFSPTLVLSQKKQINKASRTPISRNTQGNNSNINKFVKRPIKGSEFIGRIKNEKPRIREFFWIIDERQGAPDGVSKRMLVVNGQYPGPTIEVNSKDRVRVHVKNNLASDRTVIHWHGLHQFRSNYYDGAHGITECGIPPGKTQTYDFGLDDFFGSTWWHAHLEVQYTEGINGPFIIHSSKEVIPKYDFDVIMHLSDLYHRRANDLLRIFLSPAGVPEAPGASPVPESGAINGYGQFNQNGQIVGDYYRLNVQARKTYRLRLINTATLAFLRFSIDSHKLVVVEADGTSVQPVVVDSLTLGVAQRYSVLVSMNQRPNAYWIHLEMPPVVFAYIPQGANHHILGVLNYLPSKRNPSTVAPTAVRNSVGTELSSENLRPARAKPLPLPTKTYLVQASFGKATDNSTLAFINSTSWTPLHDSATLIDRLGAGNSGPGVYRQRQFIISHQQIEVIEVILENFTPIPHSFHLHGYTFWVTGFGQGRYQWNSAALLSNLRPSNVGQLNSGQLNLVPSTLLQSVVGQVRVNNSFIVDFSRLHPDQLGTPTLKAQREMGNTTATIVSHKMKEPKLNTLNGTDPRDPMQRSRTNERRIFPRQNRNNKFMRRDTQIVNGTSWIRIRFYANNPGYWLFHCHMAWHMEAGMVMQFATRTSQLPTVPKQLRDFCIDFNATGSM